MDLERLLVSKLIYTGQVEEALARMINETHFADDEVQAVWRYVVSHTRKYKSSPSLDIVRHDFPDFEFIQIEESLDWVLDRFSVWVKRRLADQYLLDLGRAADDPEKYEDIDLEFLRMSQELIAVLPTGKVSRYSDIEKRIKEHEEMKKLGKRLGIPYGLPTLDNALGGIFPHELVTILAWTNVGKSTLLRAIAFNIWLQGYRVLLFSLEMGEDEILREFDALGAKLNRQKMKQLDLPGDQMDNWRDWASVVSEKKSDIMIIDPAHKVSPDYVYAETLRHKPDIVIVDYVGLMRPNGTYHGMQRFSQLTDITQELKMNARRLRIPILMAAQSNRGGAKEGPELDNVADAISIAQDSDTVISIFQDEDMERDKEMEVRVNKSRGGPRPKFRMLWDHETPEYREKTLRDMFRKPGEKATEEEKVAA